MDDQQLKSAALAAAATALSGTSPQPGELTAYAAQLVPWIATGAARLAVTLSVDGHVIMRSSNGGTMATNIDVTNSQVLINVVPVDAGGNDTGEQITWDSSDTAGTVLAGSISADSRNWTGIVQGATGTVTVTASDPSAPGVPDSVTVINVAAGPTVQLRTTVTVT